MSILTEGLHMLKRSCPRRKATSPNALPYHFEEEMARENEPPIPILGPANPEKPPPWKVFWTSSVSPMQTNTHQRRILRQVQVYQVATWVSSSLHDGPCPNLTGCILWIVETSNGRQCPFNSKGCIMGSSQNLLSNEAHFLCFNLRNIWLLSLKWRWQLWATSNTSIDSLIGRLLVYCALSGF